MLYYFSGLFWAICCVNPHLVEVDKGAVELRYEGLAFVYYQYGLPSRPSFDSFRFVDVDAGIEIVIVIDIGVASTIANLHRRRRDIHIFAIGGRNSKDITIIVIVITITIIINLR